MVAVSFIFYGKSARVGSIHMIKKFLFLVAAFSFVVMVPQASQAGTVVSRSGVPKGTILIKTSERKLYYGIGRGKAIAYPVGVGRKGRQWSGEKRIVYKKKKPAWRPTDDIIRDTGGSKKVIPGGSPKNPMGAAALVLSGDGQYAIHGTNNPNSIGGFVSYGCIRMHNNDVMSLYKKVWPGTRVIVQ